jgi:hypothetical protein
VNRLSKRLSAEETKRGVDKPYRNVHRYIIHEGDPEPPEHDPDDLVIIRKIVSPPERDPVTGKILEPRS